MTDLHSSTNTQKAVAFFARANLSRLLAKLREKYIEMGRVGGQVLLEDTTLSERREIASFLSKPPYASTSFKVKLVDVEKALKHSFDCTLSELLTAFFPDQPLLTRQAKQAARAIHQADFRTRLLTIAEAMSQGSKGKYWLEHGQHGQAWLFSRYKNALAEEQERQLKVVRYVASVLDQLPKADAHERLALFAQRTNGDPHALDPDRNAGRLFLLALSDLANDQEEINPPISKLPQDRAQELRLYGSAGLLVDTISSSVAVCNLAGAVYHDGTPDPLLKAAGERVLLLPLRQLLEWKCIVPASTKIFLLENPQVFEELIAASRSVSPLPTLICTSGWPSVAALTLLDQLLQESPGNCLHYSGDFDLKGLQIAAYLLTRYTGHCQPWRFDRASYELALQTDGVEAPAKELSLLNALPGIFTSLSTMIQEKRKWAYQEGIVDLLVEDVSALGQK